LSQIPCAADREQLVLEALAKTGSLRRPGFGTKWHRTGSEDPVGGSVSSADVASTAPTGAERCLSPDTRFTTDIRFTTGATSFWRAAAGFAAAGLACAALTAAGPAAQARSPAANVGLAPGGRPSRGDLDATAQIHPGSALVSGRFAAAAGVTFNR
jgi:hypothetical protein